MAEASYCNPDSKKKKKQNLKIAAKQEKKVDENFFLQLWTCFVMPRHLA